MAVAAPQVIAARLARMAQSGARPGARDRAEFTSMVTEKAAAAIEAWQAMTLQTLRLQHGLLFGGYRSLRKAPPKRASTKRPSAVELQEALWGVVAKGMAPFHRRAVANAKRLGRRRRPRR